MHFSRCCVNDRRDGEELMSEGKLFHTRVPATGKARHPTVESVMGDTDRLSVEDQSL